MQDLTPNLLAVLLEETGRNEEAEKEYREAISLVPEDADTHYQLAVLLEETGRKKEAKKEYQKASFLDPTLK